MKVIGKKDRDTYLCEVDHYELEKFLNYYYGKMDRLDTGDTVNLGKGYDFAQDAIQSMKKTKDFIKSNKKIIEAIIDGVTIFKNIGE